MNRTNYLYAALTALLVGCGNHGQTELSNLNEGTTTRSALESPSCNPADLTFTNWPLDGLNGPNWMINNYVDLDPGPGVLDYQGFTGSLARTYDGHFGVDIDIPTFREMDSGAAVVRAAAPGVVETIQDGNFDRNTSCTGNWNVVTIRHPNGYLSMYGHLKRNSMVVSAGDNVTAGQILAVVGSSGCSSQPHLHFEVRDCDNNVVESFQGMWATPPAYQGPSAVMDVVLTRGGSPTVNQIKDPPPNVTLLQPSDILGVGLSLAVRGGDSVTLTLEAPSGRPDTWNWVVPSVARYGHWYPSWARTLVRPVVGTWTLSVSINRGTPITRSFNVSNYRPGFAEIARHGVDGNVYQQVFEDITAAGYRLVWIDAYDSASRPFFNVIFHPEDGVQWIARHNLTGAQYQNEFNNMPAGFRPTQVESYIYGQEIRYALIMTNEPGPAWVAHHFLTGAQHEAFFAQHRQDGYRPVNVSVVNLGGVFFFTSLYDQAAVGSWWVQPNIPASQYQSVFNDNIAAGRFLAYLNAYLVQGQVYFAGIWNSAPYGAWQARHNLSSPDYQREWETWTGAGYSTRLVTGYAPGGVHLYGGLWTY